MSIPEKLALIRQLAETDPIKYTSILEVVREGCVFCGTKGQVAGWKCAYCDDGIRTRSWEGMPDWWLATVIIAAAVRSRLLPPSALLIGALIDDSKAACDAVIAALEGRGG